MYRLFASRRVENDLRQDSYFIMYSLQKFMPFQDCLLQEQGPGMEKWRVSRGATTCLSTKQAPVSETDLDDVLQINNVFTNVSKGEVAKHDDLRKAFGKMDADDIVKEVCDSTTYIHIAH